MAVLAVGREIDGIAIAFERGLELGPQRRFVFDNQNPHSSAFQPGLGGCAGPFVSSLSSRNDHRKMSLRGGKARREGPVQGLRATLRAVRASESTIKTWPHSMKLRRERVVEGKGL